MATYTYLLNQSPLRKVSIEANFYTVVESPHGFALNFFDDSSNKISTVSPGNWISVWKEEVVKMETSKPKAESNVEDEVKVPFDFSKLSFTQTDLQKGLKLFNQLYGNKD
jgi:hypothetical protein